MLLGVAIACLFSRRLVLSPEESASGSRYVLIFFFNMNSASVLTSGALKSLNQFALPVQGFCHDENFASNAIIYVCFHNAVSSKSSAVIPVRAIGCL